VHNNDSNTYELGLDMSRHDCSMKTKILIILIVLYFTIAVIGHISVYLEGL
jgi:hypothetical protein